VDISAKQGLAKGGMPFGCGRILCLALGLLLACAAPAFAQDAMAQGGGLSSVLKITMFIIGLAAIFVIFYFMVYPILLKYFHPDYCKKLCISMMLLYTLGWFSFGAYVLFDFGYGLDWLRWVLLFISALWLVWFATVMFKKDYR
jgi:hypothetical protein